jgi:hypothetical protein
MNERDNPLSMEGSNNGERPGMDRLPGTEENPLFPNSDKGVKEVR